MHIAYFLPKPPSMAAEWFLPVIGAWLVCLVLFINDPSAY